MRYDWPRDPDLEPISYGTERQPHSRRSRLRPRTPPNTPYEPPPHNPAAFRAAKAFSPTLSQAQRLLGTSPESNIPRDSATGQGTDRLHQSFQSGTRVQQSVAQHQADTQVESVPASPALKARNKHQQPKNPVQPTDSVGKVAQKVQYRTGEVAANPSQQMAGVVHQERDSRASRAGGGVGGSGTVQGVRTDRLGRRDGVAADWVSNLERSAHGASGRRRIDDLTWQRVVELCRCDRGKAKRWHGMAVLEVVNSILPPWATVTDVLPLFVGLGRWCDAAGYPAWRPGVGLRSGERIIRLLGPGAAWALRRLRPRVAAWLEEQRSKLPVVAAV